MTAEAIFFDLDETLVDDDRCWRLAVAATCKDIASLERGADPDIVAAAYLKTSERMWQTYGGAPRTASGLTSARDLRLEVWREALGSCGLGALGIEEQVVDAYERHRRANYVCFSEVPECLMRLRRKYRLAVITNGPGDGQREKLDLTGLAPFFDLVVASNDVGIGKPDAAIFKHALTKLNLNPEQVWHVGDNLTADVGGALSAGLTAVWLNRRSIARDAVQPEPHHTIESLTQLPGLLP